MSDTKLQDLVLVRLEEDTQSEDEWSALVLAALDGPEELAIDAHMYGDGGCPVVFEVARRIRFPLGTAASDTLVRKIMLGVFGCVPAFETYFRKGLKKALGAATFGPKALRTVGEFCRENADLIERGRVGTLKFESGQGTGRRYTRAKVIDMIFFTTGQRMLGSAGPKAGG